MRGDRRAGHRPGWVAPIVVVAVCVVLAIAVSDLVAGHFGLVLGGLLLLAPGPLLRRRGSPLWVSVLAVVATVVIAGVLINALLGTLVDHVGDARPEVLR